MRVSFSRHLQKTENDTKVNIVCSVEKWLEAHLLAENEWLVTGKHHNISGDHTVILTAMDSNHNSAKISVPLSFTPTGQLTSEVEFLLRPWISVTPSDGHYQTGDPPLTLTVNTTDPHQGVLQLSWSHNSTGPVFGTLSHTNGVNASYTVTAMPPYGTSAKVDFTVCATSDTSNLTSCATTSVLFSDLIPSRPVPFFGPYFINEDQNLIIVRVEVGAMLNLTATTGCTDLNVFGPVLDGEWNTFTATCPTQPGPITISACAHWPELTSCNLLELTLHEALRRAERRDVRSLRRTELSSLQVVFQLSESGVIITSFPRGLDDARNATRPTQNRFREERWEYVMWPFWTGASLLFAVVVASLTAWVVIRRTRRTPSTSSPLNQPVNQLVVCLHGKHPDHHIEATLGFEPRSGLERNA